MDACCPGSERCELRDFAAERLGPESERLMTSPAAHGGAQRRRQAGAELADAVLASVHEHARADRALADEFLAYFLADLMQIGSMSLGKELRRFLDTGDLVQSVLGGLWPRLAETRFESRARFVALLAKRLSWRAADKGRELRHARRREDLRVEAALEEMEARRASEDEEQRDRLVLLLVKLPRRDRELLAARLRGEETHEIARRMGLEPGTAGKAIRKAQQRLREIASKSVDR
jgi:RNA polymerase sigma factor (sigma-70 family)